MMGHVLHYAFTVLAYTGMFMTGYYLGVMKRAPVVRRKGWTPSAWASAVLFDVARRTPNEADMIVAALYGVVEVCGLKRMARLAWAQRRLVGNLIRTFLIRRGRKHDT